MTTINAFRLIDTANEQSISIHETREEAEAELTVFLNAGYAGTEIQEGQIQVTVCAQTTRYDGDDFPEAEEFDKFLQDALDEALREAGYSVDHGPNYGGVDSGAIVSFGLANRLLTPMIAQCGKRIRGPLAEKHEEAVSAICRDVIANAWEAFCASFTPASVSDGAPTPTFDDLGSAIQAVASALAENEQQGASRTSAIAAIEAWAHGQVTSAHYVVDAVVDAGLMTLEALLGSRTAVVNAVRAID